MYNGHADVTALLDANGNVVQTYYYDAFGNILDSTGSADNSITYSGYYYDKETGLYYLNSRMYDPVTARFLQEDTYSGEYNDPLSLNLYTYCHNEPLMYSDPTGHFGLFTDTINFAENIGEKVYAPYDEVLRETGVDPNSHLVQDVRDNAAQARNAVHTAENVAINACAFIPGPVGTAVGFADVVKSMRAKDYKSAAIAAASLIPGERLAVEVGKAFKGIDKTAKVLTKAERADEAINDVRKADEIAADVNRGASIARSVERTETGDLIKAAYRSDVHETEKLAEKEMSASVSKNTFSEIERSVGTDTKDYNVMSDRTGKVGNITGTVEKRIKYFDDIQLKTEPNKAYFWSGLGETGAETAANIAKKNGGVTLETTIERQEIKMPKFDINNSDAVEAWQNASTVYAKQASGEVTAIVGSHLRPTNIWNTIELPALKANQNITKIKTIDPKTLAETIIFLR